MNQKEAVLAYIVLSSSAAGMLLAATFFSSSNGQMLSSFDRLVIGSALMASCVLGIVSSTKLVHFRKANGPGSRDDIGPSSRRQHIGHHPDCERFKDHTVAIGGRARCSGCLGLELGCIAGLLIILVHLIAPGIALDQGSMLVAIGLLLVLINFVETAFHSRTPPLHILANTILPVGFLLVTLGGSEATGEVSIGLVAVLVSFLLLDTRIHISDWKHAEICRRCGRSCRTY